MVKQQRQRTPVSAVAAIAAAVALAAGGGAAWWHWRSAQIETAPPPPVTQVPQSPSPVTPPVEQAQVYWLKVTDTKQELVPQPITTAANQQPGSVLSTAFNNLLAGPKDAAISTTIPENTKLRGLKVEQDGIHVNLSEEFTTGGGSATMAGRVAQVIYTATSLQPSAKVWIEVEGKPLEVLGGEGLELEQPLTRQSFQENFTL